MEMQPGSEKEDKKNNEKGSGSTQSWIQGVSFGQIQINL